MDIERRHQHEGLLVPPLRWVWDWLLLDFLTLEEGPRDNGGGVGVRDKVNRGYRLGDEEVGDLACCDATIVLAQVHSGCRVDGSGVDGLGRQ